MKNIIKNGGLFFFVFAAITYGYSYMNDLLVSAYISKSLVVPMLLVYYVAATDSVNKLFIFGLIFAFCGNLVLFSSSQISFILSMACALFFLLIHMVLIANLIGTIKTTTFLKISIPLMCVIILSIYFIFNNENQIEVLFYVFGGVLGIYIAFSYYLFRKRESNAAFLNLIGVLFFLMYCFFKGFEVTQNSKGVYSIVAFTLYPIFLFLITKAFATIGREDETNT